MWDSGEDVTGFKSSKVSGSIEPQLNVVECLALFLTLNEGSIPNPLLVQIIDSIAAFG